VVRTEILGCYVDNLSMDETVGRVEEFVRSGLPHQHVVINADKVVKAHFDAKLREIVNGCDLINADGMPVVWASWLLGRPLKGRVTGVDLFERLVARASERGWKIFLLGARPAVVSEVARILKHRFPDIMVVGFRDGYWERGQEAAVVAEIKQCAPDLLFVAISSPAKEIFLGKYQAEMRVPFAMGVGGTFDVVAGVTRRAPAWMRSIGFEWCFRFLQEPKRMFRRYFIVDMYFLWLLVAEFFLRRDRKVVELPAHLEGRDRSAQ
jgi:N-acetylglucosaminyldiphosphoundecaprenol N-acetyl-beta-D-mannosaminyltransferase